MSAEWANVLIAALGLFLTVLGFLLNSIRVILAAIRQDIKEVYIKQTIADSRICVVEEILRRLKCQGCDNG